jgi:uncharacterized protein YjgD (DUF1641 family)
MANPIEFAPKRVEPKLELQRRLAAAPYEHAEALLVAFDVLEEAHRQGALDALHGALRAKDTILGLLAEYTADPASTNSLRNLMALARLLGSLDPELVSRLTKEIVALKEQDRKQAPPTLWQLYKRAKKPEARRGFALVISVLGALGRAAD